jgi:hypothetical protein
MRPDKQKPIAAFNVLALEMILFVELTNCSAIPRIIMNNFDSET